MISFDEFNKLSLRALKSTDADRTEIAVPVNDSRTFVSRVSDRAGGEFCF